MSKDTIDLQEIRTIRGMRDLIGKDAEAFCYIIDSLKKIVSNYGYSQIETPIIEFTSLFARSLGEETDVVGKEMFSFFDRSEQSISLRPEGTASAVRALITNKLTQNLPQKWFYYGPMFRYDRPQKGRYRQFYQFGIEYLGSKSPLSDVESITAAYDVIQALNLKNTTLYLNSIGDTESRASYKEELIRYFSQYKNDLSADSQRRLLVNPLRILDSKDPKDQEIIQNSPSILHFLTPESSRFFERVQEGLTRLNIPYRMDRTLVRGLDYYDHTTFEIKTSISENQPSMAFVGGGRYNGLVQQMGGPSIPAVGWAFGIDRLILAFQHKIPPLHLISVLFVKEDEEYDALLLAHQIRSILNTPVLFPSDGNLIKRLKYSDKMNVTCALIMGEEEIKSECVKCKFLITIKDFFKGTEKVIKRSEITNFLYNLFKE